MLPRYQRRHLEDHKMPSALWLGVCLLVDMKGHVTVTDFEGQDHRRAGNVWVQNKVKLKVRGTCNVGVRNSRQEGWTRMQIEEPLVLDEATGDKQYFSWE